MAITVVQEAILNMLADAREFAVQPDEGCCHYVLRGDERSLRELMEAAGFEFNLGDDCSDVLEKHVDPDGYDERRKKEIEELQKQMHDE